MKTKKSIEEFSSGIDTQFIEKIKFRNANRKQLRTYKRLALEILLKLDEKGWSQKRLANELEVSAQYVNKLVKGNEKFGGDILCKLEEVLDMPIFIQNLSVEKRNLLSDLDALERTNTYTLKGEAKIIPIESSFFYNEKQPAYAQV